MKSRFQIAAEIMNKHRRFVPDRKLTDLYDEVMARGRIDLFDQILLFVESKMPIRPPPAFELAAGRTLWHVSPAEFDCPNRKANFFFDNENDVHQWGVPYLTKYKNVGDKLYVTEYVVKHPIRLVHMTPQYAYTDLERYISSIDSAYRPTFDVLGSGDNMVSGAWLHDNPQLGFEGWYEDFAILTSICLEIMLCGDTSRFLQRQSSYELRVNDHAKQTLPKPT